MSSFQLCAPRVALFAIAALACAACKSGASGPGAAREGHDLAAAQASASVAISEAEEALAAANGPRQRTLADERMAVVAMPEQYLKATDVKADDKLSTEHALRLVSLTLSNTSHFAVSGLGGEVTWTDVAGVDLGASPFSLSGPVGPGETKTFSSATGTLKSPGIVQGVAARSSVSFARIAFPSAP